MSEIKRAAVLEPKEWLLLEQIVLDEDKDEALKFVKKLKENIEKQDKLGMTSHLD